MTGTERAEEARRQLISAVFPEMRYGEDPDLESYLELRKTGRVSAALALYNGALRARYPDDSTRIALLSLRRSNDPRWKVLQARMLDELASKLEIRALSNIDAILESLGTPTQGNAYGSLRAVDALLRRLGSPEAPEKGLEIVDRHLILARIIEEILPLAQRRRSRGLERAGDLLREYSTLSQMDSPDAQDFVARSLALESKKRNNAHRVHAKFFDLRMIRFSIRDRQLIELKKPPRGHEDLVLAWCAKYWRLATDPAFERTVFLYARKYRTQHYSIFHEIRLGRLRGRSDDELLSALSSLLSKGYSYSITGDLYMQTQWRRIKAGLFDEPTRSILSSSAESDVSHSNSLREATPKLRPNYNPHVQTIEPNAKTLPKDTIVINSSRVPRRHALSPRKSKPGQTLLGRTRASEPINALEPKSTGSISDKIKRLSGRQYDVYRSIFLEKAREVIHRRLVSLRGRATPIFDTSINEAEDIIHGFMVGRYDDPFMNWEKSSERVMVERLGFSLPSLDGIIEDCSKKL